MLIWGLSTVGRYNKNRTVSAYNKLNTAKAFGVVSLILCCLSFLPFIFFLTVETDVDEFLISITAVMLVAMINMPGVVLSAVLIDKARIAKKFLPLYDDTVPVQYPSYYEYAGKQEIFYCQNCKTAVGLSLVQINNTCPKCGGGTFFSSFE